jgi:hypothetical protein
MKWEKIGDRDERAKVFCGWIVRSYTDVCHVVNGDTFKEGWDLRIAMCFVPDPFHWWKTNE